MSMIIGGSCPPQNEVMEILQYLLKIADHLQGRSVQSLELTQGLYTAVQTYERLNQRLKDTADSQAAVLEQAHAALKSAHNEAGVTDGEEEAEAEGREEDDALLRREKMLVRMKKMRAARGKK
jgi:hypothetical protein